jgi:magnesium-protoporphyrin O-methyltransferase
VKTYFNTEGFNRWKKIYGETDEVNKVQLDIRQGHAQTVEKVLGWLQEEGGVKGTTVCDAGCGTGAVDCARRCNAIATPLGQVCRLLVGPALVTCQLGQVW